MPRHFRKEYAANIAVRVFLSRVVAERQGQGYTFDKKLAFIQVPKNEMARVRYRGQG